MGRKSTTYTVTCHVIYEDGTTAPFESLSPQEHEALLKRMSERLSRTMSEYCQTHPGTFATIPGKMKEDT